MPAAVWENQQTAPLDNKGILQFTLQVVFCDKSAEYELISAEDCLEISGTGPVSGVCGLESADGARKSAECQLESAEYGGSDLIQNKDSLFYGANIVSPFISP
ncbi:hypothetical protein JOC33_002138 [Thalassobacillus pellis]|nr:hypothetical protein [Thalassobacillus pellis]